MSVLVAVVAAMMAAAVIPAATSSRLPQCEVEWTSCPTSVLMWKIIHGESRSECRGAESPMLHVRLIRQAKVLALLPQTRRRNFPSKNVVPQRMCMCTGRVPSAVFRSEVEAR